MTYKRLLAVVTLFVALCCALGCVNLNDRDPLPKKLLADNGFIPIEITALNRAISNTNNVLIRPCLGFDGLTLSGTHDDEFDENGSDFGDDIHGIYKMNTGTEAYDTLVRVSGEVAEAYATVGDMIIVTNLDMIPVLKDEISEILEDPTYENDEDRLADVKLKQDEINRLFTHFYTVVRHELGHMAGLSHNPNHNSMMYPYRERADHFTNIDKEFFSDIRECEYE